MSVGLVLLISTWIGEPLLAFFGMGIPAFRTGGGYKKTAQLSIQ